VLCARRGSRKRRTWCTRARDRTTVQTAAARFVENSLNVIAARSTREQCDDARITRRRAGQTRRRIAFFVSLARTYLTVLPGDFGRVSVVGILRSFCTLPARRIVSGLRTFRAVVVDGFPDVSVLDTRPERSREIHYKRIRANPSPRSELEIRVFLRDILESMKSRRLQWGQDRIRQESTSHLVRDGKTR